MKYYFITGTSKGLGHEIALQLLEDPESKVIGISRTNTIDHPNYKHLSIDLSDIGQLLKSLEDIFPEIIDGDKLALINNAGTLGQVDYVGNIPNKKIQEVFNVNTIAPSILMNEFIKRYLHYPSQKIIINVSSGAGKKPVDGWSGYCASKAALDMFSGVVGVEKTKEKYNFRIFSVSPGIVDTNMQEMIRKVPAESFSRLPEFVEYKKEGMLISPKRIAKKYIYLMDNVDEFVDIIISVRDF